MDRIERIKSNIGAYLTYGPEEPTKLSRVGSARLLKLAKFLDEIDPTNFLFSTFTSGCVPTQSPKKEDCGTVACAVGWCPVVFPRYWQWTRDTSGRIMDVGLRDSTVIDFDAAAEFFEVSIDHSKRLFSPYRDFYRDLGYSTPITAKEVAVGIREYVRLRRGEL